MRTSPSRFHPVTAVGHSGTSQPFEVRSGESHWSLRLRGGLGQRPVALRMGVPRTYVSKIENEKATPTLSSLARLAQALEVSVPDLLCACDSVARR